MRRMLISKSVNLVLCSTSYMAPPSTLPVSVPCITTLPNPLQMHETPGSLVESLSGQLAPLQGCKEQGVTNFQGKMPSEDVP